MRFSSNVSCIAQVKKLEKDIAADEKKVAALKVDEKRELDVSIMIKENLVICTIRSIKITFGQETTDNISLKIFRSR